MSKFTISELFKLAEFSESDVHHGLTIADDRSARFEALRSSEPVLSNKPYSKPLAPSDFLVQAPETNPYHATQMRLTALKDRIENLRANDEQEKAEEAKRNRFLNGLLGA
jgi:hypothetical protein